MDKNTFWQIIDAVNSEVDGNDHDGVLRATHERMMNYDPEEIADWFSHERYYRDLADTGGVFAAACCLNDYVSDDGFNDFRMWLISRGRDIYMAALKNPDTLADLELPEDVRQKYGAEFESYGYVAIGAYEKILPDSDIYDMMAQRPLSAAQKADIRSELEYFPHKVSDHDTARQLLPNLCDKYITPGVDFGFTYRNDEDEAKNLLSDAPDGLRGIALRKLEDAKKMIQSRSAFLDVPGSLREELTVMQNTLTTALDDAMSQIRELGSVRMTEDNIEIDRELFIEDDYINAYIAAWFDVDARFGTQTYGTDDYLNVYANYTPETEELEVGYTLIKADGSDSDFIAVELADSERDAILAKLRDAGLDKCIAEMRAEKTEQAQPENLHNREIPDLQESVRIFHKLEKALQGQEGLFGDWLRIAYELCEAEEIPPVDMTRNIRDAFLQANRQWGNLAARTLYDRQAAVLPDEILNAAEYLKLGGQIEHIRPLCDAGFFMPTEYENFSVEQKKLAVAHMNDGGSVDDIYDAATEQDAGIQLN